ncbi:hypothetical protein K493DRAFT_309924, partial [Basidiobolus meristosporus CBS 931.73]
NPFDKDPYPSAYPQSPVADSAYPPQNYENAVNPWSSNQEHTGAVNAYSSTNTYSNPYSTNVPNPYAQSPTFDPYHAPTPTQDYQSYITESLCNLKHSPSKSTSAGPTNTSTLTSGGPTITSPTSNNPVPLGPLHANVGPNKWRTLLRFVGLLGSIGAFGFSVGAGPYSGRPNPFSDKSPIIFLYIWSAVSIVAYLFFLLNTLNRRVRSGAKIPRKWLVCIDLALAICWGFDVVFLLIKNHCPIGTLGGWCDFFNTSIFFAFLVFAVTIVSIFWDLYGWYVERKNRLA